ncbi:hypothetical protein CKAN_01597600 [Cinnamomum micranthum f. kanehirae]|uniref:Uncharacterized protein n=1 Tax=Cinnamomum micranthum f. kanehirae TaxID=337451 RepID=A0A443P8J6_9MAGN|nr:hypothetical protein CKAN_01597600 [Cinnamomum micranthum f. kanehirae]
MTSRWEAEEVVEPEEEKEEGVREQRNERSDVRRVIERKRAPQKMIIVAIATNHEGETEEDSFKDPNNSFIILRSRLSISPPLSYTLTSLTRLSHPRLCGKTAYTAQCPRWWGSLINDRGSLDGDWKTKMTIGSISARVISSKRPTIKPTRTTPTTILQYTAIPSSPPCTTTTSNTKEINAHRSKYPNTKMVASNLFPCSSAWLFFIAPSPYTGSNTDTTLASCHIEEGDPKEGDEEAGEDAGDGVEGGREGDGVGGVARGDGEDGGRGGDEEEDRDEEEIEGIEEENECKIV